MPAEQAFDLLVIGAGLAGLAAVNAALKPGQLRVGILDGQGAGSNTRTPLTFTDTLEEFGLATAAEMRYDRFTFLGPNGTQSSHQFDGTPLAALNSHRACLSLLERAKVAGVEPIFEQVVDMKYTSNSWQIETAHGDRITARMLIDASGHSFLSAHFLGLPVPISASHSLGVRLKNCQILNPGETFFMAPSQAVGSGGGWFYPLEDGHASLGVALVFPGGQQFAGSELRSHLKQVCENLQPFVQWIKGAEVEGEEWGIIPIHPLRKLAYDHLLLVGDRAGQATSWTCMGSEMALISGRMAGEEACTALCAGDTSLRSLKRYEQRWNARYRRIYNQARLLSPLIYAQQDEQWGHNLELFQQLTPEQVIARLRTNWPLLSLWQLAWIVCYDRAGRFRRWSLRALRHRLHPEVG